MGYNFRPVERDQQYLLPPSIRDWLPEDDLAWVVLDVVDQLDLDAIRARYRADGWGAAAFDPAVMTALLLYAYATGERSSRRIESRCRRDLGYRVITANQVPDHATIARFRADHEAALGDLFGQVLRLCAAAGLGRLGLVALDGTKIAAATSLDASRTADQLDAEIARMLSEAAATDAAEDAEHGPDRRGDELPAELATRGSRLARFVEARRQLADIEAARRAAGRDRPRRRPPADPSAASASDPPGDQGTGGHRPEPPPAHRQARANPTDPDSRKMLSNGRWLQGYNGQALVGEDGVVLASGLTHLANDVGQLGPMLDAVRTNLARAGISGRITTLLADGGYWSEANLALERTGGPRLLIPPTNGGRRTAASKRPVLPGRDRMRRRLARRRDRQRYQRRGAIVEPVFGQIKEIRGIRRFQRRGRAACASEWQLVCMTHNLLKLWRHRVRSRPAGPSIPPPTPSPS